MKNTQAARTHTLTHRATERAGRNWHYYSKRVQARLCRLSEGTSKSLA